MKWRKLKSVDYIVIHAAATRPDMDIGADEIRRLHRKKGWFDIGYHYVIRRCGAVEKGRPDERPGAHARGFNHISLGVCLVGGAETIGPKVTPTSDEWYAKWANKAKGEDNYTDDQWYALEALVLKLKQQYPDAKVLGHRDLPNVNKACPSFNAKTWWWDVLKGEGMLFTPEENTT